MAPRNRGKKDRNTRSNTNSNVGQKEPDLAVPTAPVMEVSASAPVSPSHNDNLPPEEQNINKAGAESVSNQQHVEVPISDQDLSLTSKHLGNDYRDNIKQIKSPVSSDSSSMGGVGHADTGKVGDNRVTSNQTDSTPVDPLSLIGGEALSAITSELRALRSRLDTLDKIELSVSTLVTQFGGLADRTAKVESKVDSHSSNSSNLLAVNEEISSLKETIARQGEEIVKLTSMKVELSKQNKEVKADLINQNKGIIKEMNHLLEQQKNQVDSFRSTTKNIEKNIQERVEKKVDERVSEKIEEKSTQVSLKSSFQSLKDQAFAKRRNLVISGLEENEDKSVTSAVNEFLKSMRLNKLNIREAYRLGQRHSDDPSYHRPIVVEFENLSDRNKVWRKRKQVSFGEGESRVKVQADLPKLLRDELNILYRVTRAAANLNEYKSIAVRDFAVQLDGKEYNPHDLELLPFPVRPSTISNPRSEVAIAFFSKYSPLSNHHPSPFTINNQEFQNMEQYLAVNRAKLSEKETIIKRASTATDPKEAKGILRSLRQDHANEWSKSVERITTEGLRAKFSQNSHLLSFLKNTQHLQIGEASKDPRWGIGFELEDLDVLDISKWNSTGNLLGKCLMKVREEFLASR